MDFTQSLQTLYEGLTLAQKTAVEHGNGPCLVVAGAGTGKTSVITKRIAHLILAKSVVPERILALTFTEKASDEMETRLDQLLPYGVFGTEISTFHSFSADLLRRQSHWIGVDHDFKILSKADEIAFLQQHVDELPSVSLLKPHHPSGDALKRAIEFACQCKEEMLLPAMVIAYTKERMAKATEEAEKESAQLFYEYAVLYEATRTLYHQHSVFSYADLTLESLLLLRDHPAALKEEQDRYEYIMVDEFQDTNSAQHELVRYLAGHQANLMVVGDDDQGIYGFRGANITNILEFRSHYPAATIITLKDNFRSSQTILDAAYQLIQHNNPNRLEAKEGLDKHLVAFNTFVPTVAEYQYFTYGDQEYSWIAERMAELNRGGIEYSDMAILIRARSHAAPLMAVLDRFEIPYQYAAEIHFYTLPVVEQAMRYIRFLAQPDNNHNLFALLLQPPFLVDPSVVSQELHQASYLNESLFHRIIYMEEGSVDLTLAESIDFLHKKLNESPGHKPSQLLLKFLHDSPWYSQLINEDAHGTTTLLQTLIRNMQEYESTHPISSLTEYIEHIDRVIASQEETLSIEDALEVSGVQIMTVHKSKGTEYRVVFLPNLVNQRFPMRDRGESVPFPYELTNLPDKEKENHLEEERRLMYVGMTRAKEFLYMTASELYDGLKRKQKLSPFVMEAFCLEDPPLPIPGIVGEGIAPVKPVQAPKHSTLVPPTKFSASALESFEKCPLQFKYDHVLKVRIPAEANTNFGSSVHKALELWYRARREGGTPNLESLLRKAWIPGGYESKALEEKAFASAVTQLAIYLASPAGQIVPYELEQPIQYKLENGIYITGKIDRIDPTDSEGVTIVDYKTGKIPTKEAKENLPLNFYALALSQKGLSVKNVSLHYVMAGKEVTLAKEELKLDLVLRQIVELTDEIKQAYVDGDFPARPDIRTCKYCSFNKICPFRFEKGR